jgi:hypothetical protein
MEFFSGRNKTMKSTLEFESLLTLIDGYPHEKQMNLFKRMAKHLQVTYYVLLYNPSDVDGIYFSFQDAFEAFREIALRDMNRELEDIRENLEHFHNVEPYRRDEIRDLENEIEQIMFRIKDVELIDVSNLSYEDYANIDSNNDLVTIVSDLLESFERSILKR